MDVEKMEKEKKAEAKAEAKILDLQDESFCGFCQLAVVDQDGYTRATKGNNLGGTLFCTRKNGKVALSAQWSSNPLYYLQVQRDQNLYLSGDLWFGEPKKSPTNLIGKIVPKKSEQLLQEMEKANGEQFQVKVEMPFLANAAGRLATLTVTAKEEKFVTKVAKVELELSEEDWLEWKQYRLRFWRVGKAWGGGPEKADDDEKKDEKKDDK